MGIWQSHDVTQMNIRLCECINLTSVISVKGQKVKCQDHEIPSEERIQKLEGNLTYHIGHRSHISFCYIFFPVSIVTFKTVPES